jgi:DNA-binding transcriptional regulator YhcF (GntR family)
MTRRAPPSKHIAADLRRRIVSGVLRPGDRLPSTRDLAREYRVAIATATRALEALRHEGLTRSIPRVGSVVAGAGPRTASREPDSRDGELSLSRIVRAAIDSADAEGLAAVSIRGIATRLGTPVMSLYRHVPGKDALLFHMTDAVLAEESLPAKPPSGWRAQLEFAARTEWRVLRQHPWLAQVMKITRPQPLPHALALADWVLRALEGRGLSAAEMMNLHIVLHGFVQGIASNIEAEAQAANESGMSDDEWMRGQESAFEALAASGRYPSFAAVHARLRTGFELDFDALFEVGLRAFLDGLEPMFDERRRGKKKRSS